ncbi:MAG TPA: GNAT family N-acetyltransferase [Actinomycetota bacterium]
MAVSEAWKAAERAARAAKVELRPCATLEDADEILRIMIATWGEHQLVPREMIRALSDSGNEPYGAFRRGEMVGYVLGWMGSDRDGPHVHSHMLAVAPDLRSRGVGYALKLAQRAQALEQGYRVVRWTFDPLQSRNAHFNINKLGVVCDRFHRNFYGAMTDVVNRGERSDRLVVRWDLDRAAGPRPIPEGHEVAVLEANGPDDLPRPVRAEPIAPDRGSLRVCIPRDYAGVKERDPGLAAEWRDAVGDVLEECFEHGSIVVAFGSAGDRAPGYRLVRPGAAGDRAGR